MATFCKFLLLLWRPVRCIDGKLPVFVTACQSAQNKIGCTSQKASGRSAAGSATQRPSRGIQLSGHCCLKSWTQSMHRRTQRKSVQNRMLLSIAQDEEEAAQGHSSLMAAKLLATCCCKAHKAPDPHRAISSYLRKVNHLFITSACALPGFLLQGHSFIIQLQYLFWSHLFRTRACGNMSI